MTEPSPQKQIGILVVDDSAFMRKALTMMLESDPMIKVIGTACDGEDLLSQLKELEPDLVLMDLKMPVMNGVAATKQVLQHYPKIKVLVLTTYDDEAWILDALRSGASGYLLKDTPGSNLREAIIETINGKHYLDPDIAGKVIDSVSQPIQRSSEAHHIELSDREQELLELMAQGLSNADIARTLYLSEGTIRNYASNLFGKLGVSDRTQAVISALRYGLVKLNRL